MSKEFIQLKNEINKIDNQLVLLLKRRLKLVERIKKFRLDKNIPQEDRKREDEILQSKVENSGLPKSFIKRIFETIFQESRNVRPKREK